jgi:tryptophan synthase alpha chain
VSRIARRFAQLREHNRAGFIPFITAGDPDAQTTLALLEGLPGAGADIIELGVPFSDPMADGPAIQASSLRALKAGMNLKTVLKLVARFRARDAETPIVLMGYYNPIHAYGPEAFARDAARAGVDGLITVDLGPEEDAPLRVPARASGLDMVRLAAPTSGDARLATIVKGAGGFLYYVSIAGVTGTKSIAVADVKTAVARIRRHCDLPCAVGFGIRTLKDAAEIARAADAAVVGSAIVERLAAGEAKGLPRAALVEDVLGFCAGLAHAAHMARN